MDYEEIANVLRKDYPDEANFVLENRALTGRTLLLIDIVDGQFGSDVRSEFFREKLKRGENP